MCVSVCLFVFWCFPKEAKDLFVLCDSRLFSQKQPLETQPDQDPHPKQVQKNMKRTIEQDQDSKRQCTSQPSQPSGTAVVEISTIAQRAELPDWIADAFTLPKSMSQDQLLAKIQEFALAIGNDQSLGKLRKLDPYYGKLREEQCVYLASDRFGYSPCLSVNGLPKSRWSEVIKEAKDYPNWRKWVLVALHKGQPFGAVFVFHDQALPDSLWMQGIAQFDVPAHYRLCSGNHISPTLNEMLLPAVKQLALDLGCKFVYCNPINGQNQRVLKFGFEVAPCPRGENLRCAGTAICDFNDTGSCYRLTV